MKYLSTRFAAVLLTPSIASHRAERDHVPAVRVGNPTTVTLAGRGQNCGRTSGIDVVCGGGLCCSVQTETCASNDSCAPNVCKLQYSTGCVNQGVLNAELGPYKKDARAETPIDDSAGTTASSTLDKSATGPEETNVTSEPTTEEPDLEDSSPIPGPFPSLDELAALPRPQLGSIPYGQIVASCTVPGTLALTFDDGPWAYTSELLDLLEREHVRATFFVCGSNMAPDQLTGYGHPSLLRRMVESGHQIGTHTWAHPHLPELARSAAYRQMYLNEQALVGVLGLLPTYFRPPYLEYGQETLSVMGELGYHAITLDVDTHDWKGNYDASKQDFLAALGWGSDSKLVLAHDIHERTVSQLAEWMITTAKERGYRLVTVGDCLGDSVDNWYRNPYNGDSWRRPSRGE
ncbi:unnamed protein product [Discula destructiva]